MRSRALLLVVSLLFVAVGSAGAQGKGKGKQDKAKETEVVKEGKILVVRGLGGGEPQITDEQGNRYLCVGEPREELLRLSGHRVRVWGVPGDKKLMMPTLRVTRYEIVDSGGGRKPLVGMLRQPDKGSYHLERAEGNLAIQASEAFGRQLARRVGCRIWIVGDLEGTSLKASKFGWLRCSIPKAIKPRKETSK